MAVFVDVVDILRNYLKAGKVYLLLKKSIVDVRTDFVLFSCSKTPDTVAVLQAVIYEILKRKEPCFFSVSNSYFSIVASKKWTSYLRSAFKGNILIFKNNRGVININSPPDVTEQPGVIALVSSLLASKRINVDDILSSYEDMVFVVGGDIAHKAGKVLEKEFGII